MPGLFDSGLINNVKTKNRIVVPPMVTAGKKPKEGFCTDAHVSHYKKLAEGGAGIVIIEGVSIENTDKNLLGIWNEQHIEGLKKITKIFSDNDVVSIIQLFYSADVDFNGLAVQELLDIQISFAEAAGRAKKAGFDGIEIFAAENMFLDKTVSLEHNKRTDEYGGNIKGRTKFVKDIIEMCRDMTGDEFIIGYRMGANCPDLDSAVKLAVELENIGVDYIHVSFTYDDLKHIPEFDDELPLHWITRSGIRIQKSVEIPVIVVNGIRKPEQAKYIINNNLAEFTAVGRGHLADPQWSNKAKNNEPVKICFQCGGCHDEKKACYL